MCVSVTVRTGEVCVQIQELTDAMHEKKIPKGCYVIREGESGSYLYVAAEGEFEVVKAGKNLGRLGVGKVFGELAILYNCKRTASVRAVCDARVWALERKVFQHIMVASGIKKIENQKNFLKSVPLLAELPPPSVPPSPAAGGDLESIVQLMG